MYTYSINIPIYTDYSIDMAKYRIKKYDNKLKIDRLIIEDEKCDIELSLLDDVFLEDLDEKLRNKYANRLYDKYDRVKVDYIIYNTFDDDYDSMTRNLEDLYNIYILDKEKYLEEIYIIASILDFKFIHLFYNLYKNTLEMLEN